MNAHNAETLSYFKDFIKYNCYLTSVILENTGLIKPAIIFIANLLPRAQGLRSIHLCANEGINDEVIEYVRNRIRAKIPQESRIIQPFNTVKKIERE